MCISHLLAPADQKRGVFLCIDCNQGPGLNTPPPSAHKSTSIALNWPQLVSIEGSHMISSRPEQKNMLIRVRNRLFNLQQEKECADNFLNEN